MKKNSWLEAAKAINEWVIEHRRHFHQYPELSLEEHNTSSYAQEILQKAFRTDVRAIVAEARQRAGAAIDPIDFFRKNKIREALIQERGTHNVATGL